MRKESKMLFYKLCHLNYKHLSEFVSKSFIKPC